MSAFAVSDLLNPAPTSTPGSPGSHNVAVTQNTMMDDDINTGDMFAPELFQPDEINMGAIDTHAPTIFEQQGMIPLPMDHSSSPEFMRKDSLITDLLNGADSVMDDETQAKSSSRPREPSTSKDTKHSSKNEGQHTDRRYLCYYCHKLFTRRRSVRDHISKIHGEKTWEPQRSLEVVVEPHSGEPIEPIEDIIARGPPPPPPKPAKSTKPLLISEKSGEDKEDKIQKDPPEEAIQALEGPQVEETVAPTIEFRPEQLIPPPLPEATKPEVKLEKKPIAAPVPAAITMPTKLKKEDSEQSNSRPASVEPSPAPAPIIGKKRSLAQSKKGTAKVKSSTPSSKRLKLTDSERSTPARSPSATPASQKPAPGSRLKKPLPASPSPLPSSRHASPTPTPSIGTAASSNDDGEIFCICRKGDNHTWMIACDGPCEEWFHGKCVGIKERDGELIDKYICPGCEQEGFITTWKRMCRRPACRKPARVKDDPPSKYCSVACGRMFFVDLIQRGDLTAQVSRDGQYILAQKKEKKRRKKIKCSNQHTNGVSAPLMAGSRLQTPAYSEDERSEYETDTSADEEELPNRGGPLRAGEVKALLLQCKTVDTWREIGKKPETPPRELDDPKSVNLVFDDFERSRVDAIVKELVELDQKLADLTLREKLLDMVKARSAGIAEDIKKTSPKLKNVCGYDRRVAWSQDEFLRWYNSQGGKSVLESGKIGPPDDDDDTHMTNGFGAEDETTKGGVCIRNNCPKHGRTWQKSQLAELRFEQDLIKKRQDWLTGQEHEIRSRAQVRAFEEQGPVAGSIEV